MSAKSPKRPRDPNQLAKAITDIATGQKPDGQKKKEKTQLRSSGVARAV
jgi:hypothetical protein